MFWLLTETEETGSRFGRTYQVPFVSGLVMFEMLLDIDMAKYEFGAWQEAGA